MGTRPADGCRPANPDLINPLPMKLLQRGYEFGISAEDVHDLLAGLGGFQPSRFPPGPSLPDASVEAAGLFRGWRVALCEATVDRGLPDYPARRAWRRALGSDSSNYIVVFTDAAHSTAVWTWRVRLPGGRTRYTEFNAANRAGPLRAALAALPQAASESGCIGGDKDSLTDRLYRAIVPTRALGTDSSDRLQTILDRIEGFDDPDQVRIVWRRLRSFSVLDEDCSDGLRLVRAAGILEMVFVATLDRMQSFVDDTTMQRHRRRPEHLRDLRSLTEASEDRAWDFDRSRYVRRLIVQQNLFATVSTREAGRSVLRDLLGYAGAPGPGIPFIDCNIWRRRDGAPTRPWTDPVEPAPGLERPGPRPEEELALHRKAWEMVRRIRLAGGDPDELRSAACRLHGRRQLLLRQLRELDGDKSSGLMDELAFLRAPLPRDFAGRLGDRE